MKFEVIKPGNAGKMKKLSAIDCKSQDRTREIVDKCKETVQYDAGSGLF